MQSYYNQMMKNQSSSSISTIARNDKEKWDNISKVLRETHFNLAKLQFYHSYMKFSEKPFSDILRNIFPEKIALRSTPTNREVK